MLTTFALIGFVFVFGVVIRVSGIEEITFGGFQIRFSKPHKQIKK
jgi:hypothetical protein